MNPKMTKSFRRKSLTFYLLFVLVTGYLWGAAPAYAAPQIPPTDDAVVDVNNPTTNFNDPVNDPVIGLGYSNLLSFLSTQEAVLQFDLSAIVTIADESDIVLTRFISASPSFDSVTVGLYETSDSWDETSVTWNTAPAVGALLQQITITKNQTGEIRFDNAAVGAYIEAQRTGDGIASFRLRIDAITVSGFSFADLVTFGSKESPNNDAPYLDVLPESTLVDLVSFTAEPTDDSVTLRWETGDEIDNAGFNLYRATSESGQRTQINDQLIAAAGNGAGAEYTYIDERPEGIYYYWLEDVDTAGNVTLHGPVRVRLGDAAANGQRLFLPIIEH